MNRFSILARDLATLRSTVSHVSRCVKVCLLKWWWKSISFPFSNRELLYLRVRLTRNKVFHQCISLTMRKFRGNSLLFVGYRRFTEHMNLLRSNARVCNIGKLLILLKDHADVFISTRVLFISLDSKVFGWSTETWRFASNITVGTLVGLNYLTVSIWWYYLKGHIHATEANWAVYLWVILERWGSFWRRWFLQSDLTGAALLLDFDLNVSWLPLKLYLAGVFNDHVNLVITLVLLLLLTLWGNKHWGVTILRNNEFCTISIRHLRAYH